MEQQIKKQVKECPYLGTIKRYLLDFDNDQVCSVTLSNNNVYGCLVCGRYFQGKGISTPAYQHSIQLSHHVFINLSTTKIYCIPQNYEVESHTLQDIKFNLRPHYNKVDLEKLYQFQGRFNVDGKQYIPGIIGINNLKGTDYANSVFQLLNTVKEFREFFLLTQSFEDLLLDKFGLLMKKLWNPKQFKGSISPHQLFQVITDRSNKLYKIGKKCDPSNFILWLTDNLQKSMKKFKLNCNFLELFQGTLKTSYIKGIKNSAEYESIPTKVQSKTFSIIKLQFQQKGVFNKIENHVDIRDLMQFYLGKKGKIQGQGLLYMKIQTYPKYLVIVFKRFYSNDYKVQKDSSQVIYSGHLQIQHVRYKLIGQICHQGSVQNGSYKSIVCFGEKWYEIQDLLVTEVLKKQMLLGEPFVQLYEKIE